MTRSVLNVRFLLALLAVVGLAAAGVWAAHRRQAGRQANELLARANDLEQAGDRAAAADHLRRYLSLRPSDTANRGRFGLLLADTATDAEGLFRAVLVLDQTIRMDPARDDLRRRSVSIGLLLGPDTLPGATAHAEKLVTDHPNEAGLHFLLGKCHELAENFGKATEEYEKAKQLDPAHAAAVGRLAGLWRGRLSRSAEADAVITQLVEQNPRDAKAQLTAAVYWRAVARSGLPGERPAAADKCDQAVKAAASLAPDDPAVGLVEAELALVRERDAQRRGDVPAAESAAATATAALERSIAAAKVPPVAPSLEARAEADQQRERVGKLYHTRAGIALAAERFDEAETWINRGLTQLPDSAGLVGLLVETLTRSGKLDQAEGQLARLRELRQPAGLIGYRQALIQAARGDWSAAVESVEKALPELSVNPELSREVQFFLAKCYEQTGQPDRQVAALKAATPTDPDDPLWMKSRARLAAALVSVGRTAEAVPVYEELAARFADAGPPLAQLLLAAQRRKPASSRDYSRIEDLLKRAPASVKQELVKAEVAAAKSGESDPAKLRKPLVDVRDKYPDTIEPYLALAALEQRANDPAAAARWLDAAERNPKIGDRVELRLARAEQPGVTGERLKALAEGSDRFSQADQVRLLVGLAAADSGAIGDELLRRAEAVAPADQSVLFARYERAVERGGDEAGKLLDKVKQADRSGVIAKVAEAMGLLKQAKQAKQAKQDYATPLNEAAKLLTEVEALRPSWPRVPLLLADVRDNQKDEDAAGAIAAYRRGIELGGREVGAVRRLVELLTKQGRFVEVNDLLRDLPGSSGQLVAVAALAANETDRAARLAGEAVPADSRNSEDLVWLAQVRLLAGGDHAAKAEAPLKRAVEVAPDRPAGWVALVSFLAAKKDRTKDAEAAIAPSGRAALEPLLAAGVEAAITRAEKSITGPDRAAALAACYEAIGRPERAVELYKSLVTEQTTDARLLRDAGMIFKRAGRYAEAVDYLRRSLRGTEMSADIESDARRLLALSLAASPDPKSASEALSLTEATVSPETVRSRAVVLAAQPDRRRWAEAVELLEKLEASTPLRSDDHLLLAQLAARRDDRPSARRRFAAAVAGRPNDPSVLAVAARWYLTVGDAEAARPLVKKLTEASPGSPNVVELTARLAVADGKPADAEMTLLRFAEGGTAQATFALEQLERLGLGDKADPVVAKLSAAAGPPAGTVLRAEHLGRRGRASEALTLLTGVQSQLSPAVAARAAVNVLYASRRVNADTPQVDELVAEAGRRAPDDPNVWLSTALLHDLRGRYPEAVRAYRQVIDAPRPPDPPDLAQAAKRDLALAANNLAFLLAARDGRSDEAIGLVNQAREAVGPSPDLSDTEGYIHLARGDVDKAIDKFLDALSSSGGAVTRLHLASAYERAGNRLKAATEWARALQAGLVPSDLHPLERPEYDRLKAVLGR